MADANYQMAVASTILRANTGSVSMGLNLPGKEPDADEMGICIEPIASHVSFNPFEQVVYRTAAEREHTHNAKSGPGDLDLVIYSLKKYLSLALNGNPAVLSLLWNRDPVVITPVGRELQGMRSVFASRRAGRAFLGYMTAQRLRMTGERGQKGVTRPELVALHGFDTKYAMHILRLGWQGIELLTTGELTLPLPEPIRSHILQVREGKFILAEVDAEAEDYERQLSELLTTSPLPEQPDRAQIEAWMLNTYRDNWSHGDQA